jgi:hypothetical protein
MSHRNDAGLGPSPRDPLPSRVTRGTYSSTTHTHPPTPTPSNLLATHRRTRKGPTESPPSVGAVVPDPKCATRGLHIVDDVAAAAFRVLGRPPSGGRYLFDVKGGADGAVGHAMRSTVGRGTEAHVVAVDPCHVGTRRLYVFDVVAVVVDGAVVSGQACLPTPNPPRSSVRDNP